MTKTVDIKIKMAGAREATAKLEGLTSAAKEAAEAVDDCVGALCRLQQASADMDGVALIDFDIGAREELNQVGDMIGRAMKRDVKNG